MAGSLFNLRIIIPRSDIIHYVIITCT